MLSYTLLDVRDPIMIVDPVRDDAMPCEDTYVSAKIGKIGGVSR
jgi:hypothetical protein